VSVSETGYNFSGGDAFTGIAPVFSVKSDNIKEICDTYIFKYLRIRTFMPVLPMTGIIKC